MAKTTVTFSLDTDTDRDLLHWLEGLPRRGRSEAIRAALRGHLTSGVTLGDVYQELRELRRKLEAGAVVMAGEGTGSDIEEPADAAAALDNLGL